MASSANCAPSIPWSRYQLSYSCVTAREARRTDAQAQTSSSNSSSKAVVVDRFTLLALAGSWRSDQRPQRHQRRESGVLEGNETGFRQRQVFHHHLRVSDGRRVQDEDDAAPIAARVPLLNLAIQVHLDGFPDFVRHHLED